jgi:hypothetical protein
MSGWLLRAARRYVWPHWTAAPLTSLHLHMLRLLLLSAVAIDLNEARLVVGCWGGAPACMHATYGLRTTGQRADETVGSLSASPTNATLAAAWL